MDTDLTPELLLRAYANGIFPMAEDRDDMELFWVDPEERGIIPLDGFHISRSLAKRIRNTHFETRLNTDFTATVDACADRPETWINAQIRSLYLSLFGMGYAHSMEVWEGSKLVGGVFGIAVGSVFIGESMFSRRKDTSKIALACLVSHLRACGFTLFDTQFLTPHLQSLGAIEISRREYLSRLKMAITNHAEIAPFSAPPYPSSIMQRSTQTS